MKKAGAGSGGGVDPSKLTKAAKRRQLKLKKKAEEELKQKEAEPVKKAFQTFTVSSDTEEESPKKFAARQAKLGGIAGRQLFKELSEMSMGARPCNKKVFESLQSCGGQ